MAEISKIVNTRLPTDSELDRVEIIVLHYALPQVTARCLDSIINNTDWPFKLTVLDTSDYHKGVLGKIYNKLVRESTCNKIAFVCSDAIVPKGWLRDLMSVDLVTDGNVACVVPMFSDPPNDVLASLEKDSGFVPLGANEISISVSLWLDKNLLNFNEDFYLYGHDVDMLRRLEKDGYLFYCNTGVLVDHPIGTTTKSAFTKEEIKEIIKYNNEVRRKYSALET